MEIILRAKDILLKPKSFFAGLKNEIGVKKAFKYFFTLLLITTLLAMAVKQIVSIMYSYSLKHGIYKPTLLEIIQSSLPILTFEAIASLVGGLVLSFIIAGVLHGWIWLFGGRKDYSKSYQLLVYSSTPILLAGWIPLEAAMFTGFIFVWVGLAGIIYSLILLIIGTQEIHKISGKKSVLMYVVPFAIVMFLLFLAFMILSVLIGSML